MNRNYVEPHDEHVKTRSWKVFNLFFVFVKIMQTTLDRTKELDQYGISKLYFKKNVQRAGVIDVQTGRPFINRLLFILEKV